MFLQYIRFNKLDDLVQPSAALQRGEISSQVSKVSFHFWQAGVRLTEKRTDEKRTWFYFQIWAKSKARLFKSFETVPQLLLITGISLRIFHPLVEVEMVNWVLQPGFAELLLLALSLDLLLQAYRHSRYGSIVRMEAGVYDTLDRIL